jgi:hypothetical protein
MFGALTAVLIGFNAFDLAQLTITPGPGGIPIAPGAPVTGYAPGGAGLSGTPIAPGEAARDVPMYRVTPGGVPVLVLPEPRTERRGSVVRRAPACDADASCLPQNLVLTIQSSEPSPGVAPSPDAPINSIRELFAALRACWAPPPRADALDGMQMTVRFSYRRSGDIIGAPFVTYVKPGANADGRQTFRKAIDEALERCGRLPFATGFKSAIAGRPISIRYVDDRSTAAARP